MKVFYLDSNLFIFAEVGKGDVGELARKILMKMELKKFSGVTNILTVDEVVWNIRKELDYSIAIEVGKKIFELPLKILSVTPETVLKALDIMKQYGVKPRDAIHAASMSDCRILKIITEDPDFKRIKKIKPLSFSEFFKEIK